MGKARQGHLVIARPEEQRIAEIRVANDKPANGNMPIRRWHNIKTTRLFSNMGDQCCVFSRP
jgi:hypothetical protein